MIARQPAKVHTAFNPVVFEVQTSLEQVEMTVRIGSDVIELTKEAFNGIVLFDISPILTKAFKDAGMVGNGTYWEDYYLSVNYNVKLEGQEIYFTAVNSVVQAGESSSLVAKQGSFLTKFDRLRFYPGYERVISVLGFDEANYFNFEGESQRAVNISGKVYNTNVKESNYIAISNNTGVEEYLTTNDDVVITDNLGNPIVIVRGSAGLTIKRKYIDTCCVPQQPFYVRWVNTLGGRDYWMFSYRQYESNSIAERKEFIPYTDTSEVSSFTKTLSLKGKQTITAGAGNLNSNEYEALKDIIYSPRVEYYNEELGKWIEVQIDDVELSNDTRSFVHGLALNFLLSTRQMQF